MSSWNPLSSRGGGQAQRFGSASYGLGLGRDTFSALPLAQKRAWTFVAGSSALGLAALTGVGLVAKPGDGTQDWAAREARWRVSKTYGYFAGGLGLTAAAAVGAFSTPAVMAFAAARPLVFVLGGAAVSIGSMIGMHVAPEGAPQHALWSLFVGAQGLTLAPIGMLGGPLVLHAASATGLMVGSLATVAAVSPSDAFLGLAGPLTIGLGVVLGASLGRIFFPASSLLANISIYGGLVLFGGFTLYDVQRMQAKARQQSHYNPLTSSVGLYLDSINIFIRMVSILSNNRKR